MSLLDERILLAPINVACLTEPEYEELRELLLQAGYREAVSSYVSAFKQFKTDSWLKDPEILGKGSLSLLREAADARTKGVYPPEQASEPAKPEQSRGEAVQFPKGLVYLGDPAIPGGSFTWAEATVGDNMPGNPRRFPDSVAVQNRMEEALFHLQKVRNLLEVPMVITSFYRPWAENRRIGGARYSKHLNGSAVDFRPIGLGIGAALAEIENSEIYAHGGLAASYGGGFIHCDIETPRSGRRRWRYG